MKRQTGARQKIKEILKWRKKHRKIERSEEKLRKINLKGARNKKFERNMQ